MNSIRRLTRLCALSGLFVLAGTLHAQTATNTSSSEKKVTGEDDVAQREKFFYDRLTSGEIKDVDEIHRLGYAGFVSMENRSSMKEQSSSAWQSIGAGLGGYASGRIRSIAFDPVDTNVVYVAATLGGLWKTANYSADSVVWVPLADNLPTLVCTAVAIPRQQPKTIYLGTGETDPGYSSSDGRGVFKSIDGGLNWTNVLPSSLMGPTCAEIVIDPQHPDTVFVAAPARIRDNLYYGDTDKIYGLFRTLDGGVNWTKLSLPSINAHPVSLVIDPIRTRNVTVSCLTGEIYHSNDGGSTWNAAAISYADTADDPVLAISTSNPNILYASIAKNQLQDGLRFPTEGLYSSQDSGMTWTLVNDGSSVVTYPGSGWLGNQGQYCNAIVIDPLDPMHLVMGGLDNYESMDGGVTLDSISVWWQDPSNALYSHADMHTLAFHNGLLFCGSDGGLSTHSVGGWAHNLTAGMPTLQFVSADADPDFNFVIGGTQDNGTNVTPISNPSWIQTRGGDGGNTWVSPSTPLRAFATYVRTNIYRSDDSLRTWSDDTTYGSLVTNAALLKESAPFYASYDVSTDGAVVAFGGFHHVYISQDGGDDGFAVEGVPTIDTSASILVSPNNSNDIWAGTTGHVFRTTNQGVHWTASNIGVAGQVVGLALGNSDTVVYAVVAGLTSDSNAHFLKSANGGATWLKPATNFPMTPANCLTRSSSGQLFVGTDYGVITSTDDGATWSQFGIGMPRVQVLSLKVKGKKGNHLLAATEGRGVYSIDLASEGVETIALTNFGIGECYPNPASANQTSHLMLTLKNPLSLRATLCDCLGRSIQLMASGMFSAGAHDISISTSGLSNGDYFLVVQADGHAVIRKLTVVQ
jgi:hypothetical protein